MGGSAARRRLRRISCALVSSVVLSSLLFVAAPRAQEKLSIKLEFLPYGMHAPFYLAVEKGWFKQAGLDVSIEDGNGSAPAIQLVGAGKYDIAEVDLGAMIMARDNGVPVKAIAGILRRSDIGALVAANSNIHTPKDLEGKTVYYSPNSVESLFIDSFFKKTGVDKAKVKLISIDLSAKVSTYLSGNGDAMFSLVPLYTIDKLPRHSRGILFADYGIQVPGFGLIANDDDIQHRQKALAAFVSVFQRSWNAIRYGNEKDAAVAALIKERPQAKLNPVTMKEQIESVIPFMDTPATKGKPTLWQSKSDWESTIKGLEAVKAIKPGSKPEDYYTNAFVPNTSASR